MVSQGDPSRSGHRATHTPDVLVVVVTYNSAGVIGAFLRALPAALEGVGSWTVLAVDNDSHDGTADMIAKLAPWMEVVHAGANLGYAAAINRGLERFSPRRGAYILNPDAIPSAGSVAHLARAVEAHTNVGIAVPRIVGDDGQLQFSLRREPTIGRAWGEAILGGRRASKFPALGEVITDPAHYVDGATADWATGAAMFLSPEALTTVGPWAEDYFLYSEETDYALRCRDAGLRIRYVAHAHVTHKGGDMARDPWLWSLAAVNRTRLYRKRHGPVAATAFWLAVVLNEAGRSLLGHRTHRSALRALLAGGSGSGGLKTKPG